MIRKTRITARLVSLLVLSFAVLGSFSMQTALAKDGPGVRPVTKAMTITQSGSYVLLRDIALGQPGSAIVIAADNVSLNLNGHSLVGPGNKQGIGIEIEGVNSISVHN